jgi:hypothetical protein
MIRKVLIATATAALIATGAALGSPTSASAAVYIGGPQFGIHIGPTHRHWQHRDRVCRPVFKTQRWRDRWGRLHYSRVIVGHRCYWTYRRGWDGRY